MSGIAPEVVRVLFPCCTVLALVSAIGLALWRTQRNGGLKRPLALVATILGALIVGHVVSELWQRPRAIIEAPWALLAFWTSGSTAWGLPSMLLIAFVLTRKSRPDFFRLGDELVLGLVVGWAFLRLGCTIAFDHVGDQSDFFLAMDYPMARHLGLEPGPRHNLGFYELLGTAALFLVERLARRGRAPGWSFLFVITGYSCSRFALEFMQVREGRLGGLTLVQMSLIVVALALVWLWWRRSRLWPAEEKLTRPFD